MDAELAALAGTAGSTVVTLLATDAWGKTKTAVGALWRRVHPQRAEVVEAELVEARTELLAARAAGNGQAEQALVGEWQSRIRRLLASDPNVATELREVMALLDPAGAQAGKYAVDLRDAKGVQVGDHNTQTNHF